MQYKNENVKLKSNIAPPVITRCPARQQQQFAEQEGSDEYTT